MSRGRSPTVKRSSSDGHELSKPQQAVRQDPQGWVAYVTAFEAINHNAFDREIA
jgi:hypothetical protein